MLKSSARMEAIGSVDEANSALGIALAHLTDADAKAMLGRVQNELFDLGADIATPGENFTPSEMNLRIEGSQIERLESEIDVMNADLAPLTSFILPGGDAGTAALHLARAIVRRAERSLVKAAEEEPFNPLALVYLNRLSDHFFVLCRRLNAQSSGDILWKPGATRAG